MRFEPPTLTRSDRRPGGPIANRWAALAVPAIVFLLVGFLVPLIVIASRSVTEFPRGSEPGLLANYQRFFAGEANVRVLGNTFWIAGLSTLACLLIGYPYAYLMNLVRSRLAGLLLIAVLVPVLVRPPLRTFARG